MARRTTPLQREIKQKRPFRSRGQEATIALLRTADVVRRRLTRTVEPHGITLQQYNVLRILKGASPDPLPTLEIAQRMIEEQPGITRLLDRLGAKGLVRRERCADDRRQVHCWITKAGLDLLAELDPVVNKADEAAVAALSPAQLQQLLQLLEVIRTDE
ncbi:MAG: MarR family transcriptional regulator [Gemmatimonadota bacterium]|nr:MarR family transcriptional regulator [Gemmatimonadota bacterium]